MADKGFKIALFKGHGKVWNNVGTLKKIVSLYKYNK